MARICIRNGDASYVAELIADDLVSLTLIEPGKAARRHRSQVLGSRLVSLPFWLSETMHVALIEAVLAAGATRGDGCSWMSQERPVWPRNASTWPAPAAACG